MTGAGSVPVGSWITIFSASARNPGRICRDRLNVRIGIEIGTSASPGGSVQENDQKSYPFDFVIGSLHLVNGMDPYYGKIFEGRSDAEVYREAFQDTLECIWIR